MKHKGLSQPEALTTDWVFGEIAQGIDLASKPTNQLSEAEQWKIWLRDGVKTPEELIFHLRNAPGRPDPGERITDVPVPFYEPGPVQWTAHNDTSRTILVAGGWRAGKSKWLAAQLLPYLFKDHARVWIVANDYVLAREEFSYIEMWLQWLGAPLLRETSRPQDGRWQLWTRWGAHLETQTAADVNKLEAAALDAAGLAEAGQIEQAVLTQLRSRVFQKRGRIFLAGSLTESQPWYVTMLKKYVNGDGDNRWKSYSIPSWDNRAVFPGGREDPEIKHMEYELPEDDFNRKVASIPVKASGLVFKEFDEMIHVTPIDWYEITSDKILDAMQNAVFGGVETLLPPMPKLGADGYRVEEWDLPETAEVEVAIDPGSEHAYAVLAIVRSGHNVFVIDEIYVQDTNAEDVIDLCKRREWWPKVRTGVIDIAGKQHQGMNSHKDIWNKVAGIHLKYQYVPIEDGIQRLRTFLINPKDRRARLWIDPKCEGLIDEFGKYIYYPHKENRPIREKPIDAHNHSIKALTYFLVVHYDFVDKKSGTQSRKYVDSRNSMRGRRSTMADDSFGWAGL